MSARSIDIPDDGVKVLESSIHADDAALGDVLTVVDDGAGGKESQWQEPAITPDDLDPGVPLGTPGTVVLTLWTGEIIVPATSAATRPVDLIVTKLHNCGAVRAARLLVVVCAAAPTGTKLVLRVLPFVLGSWSELGVEVALDDVNESDGVLLSVPGAWVDWDASYQLDNMQLELAVKGGNDTGEAWFAAVYLELLSVDASVPPVGETPTPPDVPTTNPLLVADWDPTEGSGGTVVDKS